MRCKQISEKVVKAFNIIDICRIDVRVNESDIYVIDINCISSYDLGTHFTLLGKYLGISHKGMLYKLFDIEIDRLTKERRIS